MDDANPRILNNLGIEPSETQTGSGRASRVAVLVGGTISKQRRREIEEQQRPRIDVLELERTNKATLYDFNVRANHAQYAQTSHLIRRIGEWTHQRGASLAYQALPWIRDNDVVYTTGEDVGFPLAALLRTRNLPRPRLVVRLEQPTYGRTLLRKSAYAALVEYAMPRIDRVLCRTTAHLHYLHSIMNVPIGKLRLVRETVDTRFFDLAAVESTEGFNVSRPLVVSAGLEMRDYPTLVDSVRDLGLDLVIGAGSPWSQMSYGHQSEKSLPPNVRVSAFSPAEMRALYAAAAMIVVPVRPSLRACGMNVILEGWAMEKVVIATRTVGLLDYVVDGRNGLFVPPYDVVALRSRIIQVLDRPELFRPLSHEGHTLVQQDLNLDHYIERINAELLGVVRDGDL